MTRCCRHLALGCAMLLALMTASTALRAQHRNTRFPNAAGTEAPYDFWFGKSPFGSKIRISGPDTVTGAYWIKWPKTAAVGCLFSGAPDTDGAYPLSMSPSCMAINAHFDGASWIADSAGLVVGRLSGSTFTLDSAKLQTVGTAVTFSSPALITGDIINRFVALAPLNADLLTSLSGSIKIGNHATPNYFGEGAFASLYSDAILPESDNTSTIGSGAHPFGAITQGSAATLTTDGLRPVAANTSSVGTLAAPFGDSFFKGITLGADGINLGDITVAAGHSLTIASGASLAISGSTSFGGTANMSGIFNFSGTVQASGTAGVSVAGTTCTITAISNGIVTGAHCP